MLDENQRALCATTAAWLGAQRVTAAWTLWMTAASAAMLWAGASGAFRVALLGAMLGGVFAAYLALRIAFDARLFSSMASGSITQLGHLDAALQRLHLRPAASAPRSLEDRAEGARRLVHKLLILTALQTVVVLICLATLAHPNVVDKVH